MGEEYRFCAAARSRLPGGRLAARGIRPETAASFGGSER